MVLACIKKVRLRNLCVTGVYLRDRTRFFKVLHSIASGLSACCSLFFFVGCKCARDNLCELEFGSQMHVYARVMGFLRMLRNSVTEVFECFSRSSSMESTV